MKIKKSNICLAICTVFFLAGCVSGIRPTGERQTEMSYSRLKLMDLDEMTEILQEKVRVYKRTNSSEPLQEGLEICLSRPDEDSLVEKTLSIVKNPLDDIDEWESSINALVDKSIANLKTDGVHPSDQVTSGVVLENIIAEFKPDLMKQYESPGFEARIVERIAGADVEYSKAAISERKLNLMRGSSSTFFQISQPLSIQHLLQQYVRQSVPQNLDFRTVSSNRV